MFAQSVEKSMISNSDKMIPISLGHRTTIGIGIEELFTSMRWNMVITNG